MDNYEHVNCYSVRIMDVIKPILFYIRDIFMGNDVSYIDWMIPRSFHNDIDQLVPNYGMSSLAGASMITYFQF